MHAIIATGGKQYRVQEADVIEIERIPGEVGEKVTFKEVLAVGNGADLNVGAPTVEKAEVEAEIMDQFRGVKLIVFKMKRRKGLPQETGAPPGTYQGQNFRHQGRMTIVFPENQARSRERRRP